MAHVWQTAAVAALAAGVVLLPAPPTMRRLVPLRGLVFLTAGLLAAIFLLASDQASAQQIPEDEQKCIVELNKGFAKVVKAQFRENVKCVKLAGWGRVASAELCLTADSRGRVAKAKSKNEKGQTRRCTGVTPPFGATDAATGNQAAVLTELDLIHDIFGSDLDAAIIDASVDRAGRNCQVEVAKLASRCQDERLKSFNECKKNGLEGEHAPLGIDLPFDDSADLERCMTAIGFVATKIYTPCFLKTFRKIRKKCATTDIATAFPGVAAAFPSDCSGTADSISLPFCLDHLLGCNLRRALSQVDGLPDSGAPFPYTIRSCGGVP